MKKIRDFSLILVGLLISISSIAQSNKNITKELDKLDGIEIKKVRTLNGFTDSYMIMVEQPVDHNNPDGPKFEQRIWLSHLDFNKPMVFITDGYTMPGNYRTEIARILNSNQILVEHRYFGESVPDSMNWSKLNLFQACQDLHHIRTLLGKIYKQAWISSGISKGGQTTIAYKFFFPNDVSASVPYVAPFTFAKEDDRILDFLANKVGSKIEREKILNFQKAVLTNKKVFLPLVTEFEKKQRVTFDAVGGYEAAFEYGMLEFSFAFWQWGSPVSEIPNNVMNIDSTMNILKRVNPFDFFTDQGVEFYKPYFYQALTEMGIYTYDTTPFEGLLKYAQNPTFDFTITDIPNNNYSVSLNVVMNQWLQENGNNMVYIYGGVDPWGACSMKVDNNKVNSLIFTKAGGSHATRIQSFDKNIQKQIMDSLSVWTDFKF